MKKVITMLMAIVTSVAMSAQALVWDGSAEPWTHGSGTHDDPYLIETPQQLAFLADLRFKRGVHAQHLAGHAVIPLAGVGERQAAGGAPEEPRAQLLFDGAHAMAQ